MKRQLTVRTCDECGKEVSDDGSPMFGGAVDGGWLHVYISCGSTQITQLCKKHAFDFCSRKCAIENLKKE